MGSVKKALLRALGGSSATKLDLRENVQARVNLALSSVARHQPKPGTAVMELVDDEGRVLELKTVKTGPAPLGAFHAGEGNKYPATFVKVGLTGLRHQEVTVPIDAIGFPFHLLRDDELGGTHVHVWWSCEKKGGAR